jgi:hypothetical protein
MLPTGVVHLDAIIGIVAGRYGLKLYVWIDHTQAA